MHFLTLKRKLILFTISLTAFLLSFSVGNIILAQTVNQAELLMSSSLKAVEKGKTFTVNLGINNSSANNVTAIDAILYFNSNLFEVIGAELGTSNLKTLVPGDNNVLDLTKAVTVNPDPTKSTLEIGLVAFDQSNDTVTPGISGNFDPDTSPLVKITFKAKALGSGQISFKFDGNGVSTDSNIVILNSQNPEDIIIQSLSTLNINVIHNCTTIDFNGDSGIDIGDVQAVSSRWGMTSSDPEWNGTYDLNQNGTIDISDIQSVAGRWGESCMGTP